MARKPRSTLPLPTGQEFATLAAIARIPPDKTEAFRRALLDALREARRGAQVRGKPARAKDAVPHLDRLRRALTILQAQQAGEVAGVFLNAVIVPSSVNDWIRSVDHAKLCVTENPSTRLGGKGAPQGTRNNPAFDVFVAMVVVPVNSLGGKLTCYRKPESDKAGGTFIALLEALREFLPDRFIAASGGAIVRSFRRANTN